jgi:hypothetical protein
MAAATRLTEPLRTSPTANMPGLLVAIGEQHITSSHVALAAIPAQHSELGRIQDRRTPRKRDQAIAAVVGRLRGSSRSSASRASCAHQLTVLDGPVSARVTQSATIEANCPGTSSQAK